jgi:hypothetical protein
MSHYLEPSFFLIGERKCASSSLYRYLIEHPQVLPCKIKEPQFFSKPWWYRLLMYSRYRRLFPLRENTAPVSLKWHVLKDDKIETAMLSFPRTEGEISITGEASANYFSQASPDILKSYYPKARLIICLRDPVERAFSHYRMLKRFAAEGRSLPFRPDNFHDDSIVEIEAIKSGGKSYFVAPGMYLSNLLKWESSFPASQLLVIRAEDLQDPRTASDIMNELCEYLEIREFDFGGILSRKFNVSDKVNVPGPAADILRAFYKPHVGALEQHLQRKMHWF